MSDKIIDTLKKELELNPTLLKDVLNICAETSSDFVKKTVQATDNDTKDVLGDVFYAWIKNTSTKELSLGSSAMFLRSLFFAFRFTPLRNMHFKEKIAEAIFQYANKRDAERRWERENNSFQFSAFIDYLEQQAKEILCKQTK